MKTIRNMKKIALILSLMLSAQLINAQDMNIHQFTVNDINGEPFEMASLKGNKIMVVNTASECGLTPQYEILEELYKNYKAKGLVIVGFPANNFGGQEPGTNEEIKGFCQKNYGVSFPMMSKISVKGDDKHEIYQWLTEKSKNGLMDAEVSWNFQKFLIDENGKLVGMIPPQESPASETVLEWLGQ